MRFLTISALALVASAGIALADDISGVYGATVSVKAADGSTSSYNFAEDGTYATTAADGTESSGTWTMNDAGEVCVSATAADGTASENCSTDLIGKTVGDTWEYTDPDGNVSQVEVIAGD